MSLDRRIWGLALLGGLLAEVSSCTTLPQPKFTPYAFPKSRAFLGEPERPYKAIGTVRTKVNYPSLDPQRDEAKLCKNYFNKAVIDLVKRARANGGDAVINVKSVVFMFDGTAETYARPECSDDGAEGQVLTMGTVVKWVKPEGKETESKESVKEPAPAHELEKPHQPIKPQDPVSSDW